MTETKSIRNALFDDELASVNSAVVGRAERDEILRRVSSAFGARVDVVDVEERPVTATGDAAPTTVSSKNDTPYGRRNVLFRASGARFGAHVGIFETRVVGASAAHGADALSIASRHLDDFRADFDELAATVLFPAAARLANRQRNLVARATVVLGSREHLSRKEEDRSVVVERFAGVAPKLG